ncbi:MAG: extracellular solute-binding protein [Treponema sp.]|jgi:multiple sugar transport system substrate-binding protein|nr:extracellular solute-binding protein [Treponema sp.]
MDIKKFDRRLFALALIVLGVFAFFGFLISGGGAGRKAALTFTHFLGDRLDRGTLVSLIREFEAQNPGVRIRLDRRRAAGPEESARINLSADIVIFDERQLGVFLRDDLLAPLDPYMESGAEPDQRVVPLVSFMDLLFYHVEMLKAAGFDRPPGTRAEFLACAQAVAAEGGGKTFGAALALSPAEPLSVRRDVFSWIWAAGSPLIRDGRADFSSRPVTETLEFLRRLYAGGLLSPGVFEKTGAEKTGEFAEGKIAMMIGPAADIPVLRKRMGDAAFGVTLIPGPGDQPGRTVINPSRWYAAISGSCKKTGEAWTFLTFLMEKSPLLAAQAEAVPGGGNSPGPYILEDPFYSRAWDIYEAAEPISDIRLFSGTADLEAVVREELAALFSGEKNAAEAAAAIEQRRE